VRSSAAIPSTPFPEPTGNGSPNSCKPVSSSLVRKEKLSAREAQKMRLWHHSGFNIHSSYLIQRDDHDGLEHLAQYILRNPFSLEKMTCVQETGVVIHRSKRNHPTATAPLRYSVFQNFSLWRCG
jgi:hypothetical protein